MSERTGTYWVYMTWATSKAEAIRNVTKIVTDAGYTVVKADAERFPEGKDYRVNWKVWIRTAEAADE